MWAIVNREKDYTNGVGLKIEGAVSFLCESTKDIFDGPYCLTEYAKKSNDVGIGSSATVIETAEVYIYSPSKKWLKYGGVSIKN